MSSRILALTLHPGTASFNAALTHSYAEAARQAGHSLRLHALAGMQFDPDFGQSGFSGAKPLEPDLQRVMADLEWAEHLLLVAPMWWGGLPARAKGLFDRILLPGTAFDPRRRRHGVPLPLLTGKTARLILTSDTPGWLFRPLYGAALRRQIERQILGFVGIRPMRFTHFSPVEKADDARRSQWLAEARTLGARAA